MWKRTSRRRRDFEKAALEHLDTLYGVALRLTRNEQNAEDLVQDTYVRALRFYERFEWGTNMRAWLLRIMTNTFINSYRRNQKERQITDRNEGSLTHDLLLSSQTIAQMQDPESQLMSRMLRESLVQAVDELPEDFKVAVTLADVYGFSYREIAEIQDCPIGTVMSRLHRARKALQARLLDQAILSGIVKSDTKDQSSSGNSKTTDLSEYRRRRMVS